MYCKNWHRYIFKNIDLETGDVMATWMDSLAAFWPGLQVSAGDLEGAIYLHQMYFTIWRKYSALPERFDFAHKNVAIESYPLRPELAESTYFLYQVCWLVCLRVPFQATKNPYYLHVGERILLDIEHHCRTLCGFAGIKSVLSKTLEGRMESFFLSEVLQL